jgi:hypothetical protein
VIHPDKTVQSLLHGDRAAVLMGVHNAMGAKMLRRGCRTPTSWVRRTTSTLPRRSWTE